MIRTVAHWIELEPRLYYALFRWLSRRPRGANTFAYHGRSMLGVVVLLVLFVTPFEAIIPILLVPWGWLRWLLLALDLYTLLWLASLHASLVVLAHRLEEGGIQLHYGAIAGVFIPYEAIEAVRREQRAPGGRDGLQVKDGAAYLGVGGQTDVAIELHSPIRLQGLRGRTPPVCEIHIAADEPTALVRAVEARLMPQSLGTPP